MKILVVGDIMLDFYRFGVSKRMSPEVPVPISINPTNEYRLGGAANVAANIASLGFSVGLLGCIGNDYFGGICSELLMKKGIDKKNLIYQGKTVVKERHIVNGQQILRIDEEFPELFSFDKIYEEFIKISSDFDFVVISDYQKGVIKKPDLLIKKANELGLKIIIDPKLSSFKTYRNSFLITPNEKEFRECKEFDKTKNLEENAINIRKKLNCDYLVVTLAESGALLVNDSNCVSYISTKKVEVKDVTGAGDVFVAVLTTSMIKSKNVKSAIHKAVKAATYSVTKSGTIAIGETDFFQGENKTVVFTNGCFDILHIGHIDYLKKAKKFGDTLIIGLNSDRSVSRIKGNDRPVIPVRERKALLEALDFVDDVIIFDEDTPIKLIKKISPQVLVKGGDYKPSEIAGSEFVKSYGGKVKSIEIKFNQSTSKIIETLLKDKKHDRRS